MKIWPTQAYNPNPTSGTKAWSGLGNCFWGEVSGDELDLQPEMFCTFAQSRESGRKSFLSQSLLGYNRGRVVQNRHVVTHLIIIFLGVYLYDIWSWFVCRECCGFSQYSRVDLWRLVCHRLSLRILFALRKLCDRNVGPARNRPTITAGVSFGISSKVSRPADLPKWRIVYIGLIVQSKEFMRGYSTV